MAESVKGRLCAEKSEGRGGSAAKQVPPQPGTTPALGLRAGAMIFSLYRRPALERRSIMSLSSWLQNGKSPAAAPHRRTQTSPRQRASFRPHLESLEDRCLLSTAIVQTNLVSDDTHFTPAQVQDPNLVNPWGLAASPTAEWWVANQGTGTSTLYNTSHPQVQVLPLVVNVPPAQGAPTGEVFNTSGTGFNVSENGNTGSSVFLFATTGGTISGWSPGVDRTHAVIGATHSGALYLGLAIATDRHGDTRLYAADFLHNTIDVYDQNFHLTTTLRGHFTDSHLPDNYHAFNIQAINDRLYVEYAPADKVLAGTADPGDGAVDVYNADGRLQQRLIRPHDTNLNQPWAIAMAPQNFGRFSNDLLVGNFGDGHINAFNPHSGRFVGELRDPSGQPIAIRHLWALAFGNGGTAGPTNTLYFTAGLTSHLAHSDAPFHGLFGSLQVARGDESDNDGGDQGGPQDHASNLSTSMLSYPIMSSSMMPTSTMPTLTMSSPSGMPGAGGGLQTAPERTDAIFQELGAGSLPLDSNLTAMHPQPSGFFAMINANLDALEAAGLSVM
jgi:uncharacterized protein (TIGR03118 family)